MAALHDENRYIEKGSHGKDNVQDCGQEQSHPHSPDADKGLLYSVEDTPPWYLCVLLGFQHFLTAFGSLITVPLTLAPFLCMTGDELGVSEVLNTMFFVSGLCTLLQSTFGTRLPIVQGSSFALLVPSIAILTQKECPSFSDDSVAVNDTLHPVAGGTEHRAVWMARMQEIQGAIIVASLFQVVIGFSGLIGLLLRFIGPLGITPTIVLIGLALFGPAADKSATQWWIALTTVLLITIFSQFLIRVKIPFPTYKRGIGCVTVKLPIFGLFPVLLAILLSWLICYILTVKDVLPSDKNSWGYLARTDTRAHVISAADWFRFPYPGQWGVPIVTVSGVFGMLAGILASMIESVGDYYACARLSGAPSPPEHAVNRGITIEGIGCILAGAWGTGNGTTSFSENIGAIGITRVGSRRVVQVGAIIMVILGCLGKFGALFVTIPDPVVGGMFLVMFGMITAVGLSNLQYVDMNSPRNLFILGFSIFFGLSFPIWMKDNNDTIKTGEVIVDQILTVMCSTSMFIGGLTGILLDNIIPGTDEERGIKVWRRVNKQTATEKYADNASLYDLPLIQKYLNRWRWPKFLPFCPTFMGIDCGCCNGDKDGDSKLQPDSYATASQSPANVNHSFVNDTTDNIVSVSTEF